MSRHTAVEAECSNNCSGGAVGGFPGCAAGKLQRNAFALHDDSGWNSQTICGAKILNVVGSALTETEVALIPAGAMRTGGGANSQNGFRAEYFGNAKLSGTASSERVDAQVNFDWGGKSPAPGVDPQSYSVRWSGELTPSHDGDYRIGAQVLGGFRLYVNDELLLDRWNSRDYTEATEVISLASGRACKIVLEYTKNGEGGGARMIWSAPGIIDEAVDAAKKGRGDRGGGNFAGTGK